MTLVVNLYGGPGTGKSTTAAGTFFELKNAGVNCELVTEYAKDVVWARTTATLDNQLYVFAKQHHRFFRLLGQVDVIVTDSPLMLMLYYGRKQSDAFKTLVQEEIDKLDNLHVYLNRVKAFNPKGRLQDEDEAKEIDQELWNMLLMQRDDFEEVRADYNAPQVIAAMVHNRLEV